MNSGLIMSLLASILMLFSQRVNADIIVKVMGTGGIIIIENPDGTETTKICPIKDDHKICAEIVIETLADGTHGEIIANAQRIPVQIGNLDGLQTLGDAMQILGSQLEIISIR